MEPDKLQQAWQTHSAQTRVTVDADLLLREVQRNQRVFGSIVFRRDLVEVGIALLLLPYWLYAGNRHGLPWSWYLMVPVLVWLAGFMLVYHLRHKPKPGNPDEPLLPCVERSLTEVEAQSWLLRNIFWWYLLPPGIALSAFFVHVAWLRSNDWREALASGGPLVLFVVALYYLIYWLNQRAVRTQLEPRRRELLALRASLGDESTGEPVTINSVEIPERSGLLKRLLIFACLGVVVFQLFAIAKMFSGDGSEGEDYPKLAPFAAVRWQDSQPEVKVGEEWYRLVSLNDVPAAEIVAFSRETYADKWQKRFEEDLVELLSHMGHPPQDKVKLVVQSQTSSETQTLDDVPMTVANRRSLRNAAQARERGN